MKENTAPIDVYKLVTDKIIAQLEKGQVPWKRPWTISGLPQNLISGRPYRGINVMLLASLNYAQNYFLSFKQTKEIGAHVIKVGACARQTFHPWQPMTEATLHRSPDTLQKVKYFQNTISILKSLQQPKNHKTLLSFRKK